MLSRRELITVGSAGLMGIGLPQLLAAREAAKKSKSKAPQADQLIILFLNGGPSHLDMWDMKPNGPTDSRGQFKPISSTLPGIPVSEHLPRLAKWMHMCTLVRSMHHSVNNSHAAAVYAAMTGHDRGEVGGGFRPTDRPTPGSVAAKLRPSPRNVIPHVVLPYKTKEGAKGPPQPGFFAGILGSGYDPLFVLENPNSANFSVPVFTLPNEVSVNRMSSRGDLLSSLNGRLYAPKRGIVPFDAMGRFQQRAYDVLTSTTTQAAFRIQEEPAKVRDTYGRNIYGQSTLLARRLIEAGTRVVTISWAPDANATWDTHSNNFKKLKGSLLPQFDAAFTSLMADLQSRQMLERTVVAVIGDFGRTPKINKNGAGRDHWNYCYSVLLAGGGFQRGLVYGASDKTGAFPADSPTLPGDIIATIFKQLGIDHRRELYDRFGRPHQIVSRGNVVDDLLA